MVAAGLQEEQLAVGQTPCACPPNTPGRQRGSGLRSWGWRHRLLEASWSLSPREGEAAASGRMGSTSSPYPPEQSSRASKFQGYPVWFLLTCFAASVTQRLLLVLLVSISVSVPQQRGELLQRNFVSLLQVLGRLSPPQCPFNPCTSPS